MGVEILTINGEILQADDGLFFGLGVFETIMVDHGIAMLLDYHLDRIMDGCHKLSITVVSKMELTDLVNRTCEKYYSEMNMPARFVVKLQITEKNVFTVTSPYRYTEKNFEQGFTIGFSKIMRNETSVFTSMKSLNYGDNIIEKRLARQRGYDEPIFFNSKNEICEGATTNVFIRRGERIITPPVTCGLLPGTVRRFILENEREIISKLQEENLNIQSIEEGVLKIEDLAEADEVFVTNALLIAMPVTAAVLSDFAVEHGKEMFEKMGRSNEIKYSASGICEVLRSLI